MSAVNFSTSLFVIKIGSIAHFGVYSFLFAFSILASGLCGTLVHRQMVLHISPKHANERAQCLKSSVLHELILLLLLCGAFVACYWIFVSVTQSDGYLSNITLLSFLLYVVSLNLFDLFRQYLYTNDLHTSSLKITLVFLASVLVLQLLILVSNIGSEHPVAAGYITLCSALLIAIAFNKICSAALHEGTWPSISRSKDLFADYFRQGRFGSVGSVVTWFQNQSMGPILMFIAGPVIVGYFNIGRLFAMPISVVSQGLVNSTLPGLRRTYVNTGASSLRHQLNRLGFLNVTIGVIYAMVLLTLDHLSILETVIPEFSNIRFYVFFWMLLIGTTLIRFWIGQFFIVTLQLNVLLVIGLIATTFSMTLLVVFGYLLKDMNIAMFFIILGEVLSIILLLSRIRKEPTPNANQEPTSRSNQEQPQ